MDRLTDEQTDRQTPR